MRIRFGPFTLNLDTRQLTRNDRDVPLTPKAFDLLAVLVRDRPKVVSKAALQEKLWPSTFVAEANISNLMSEVRDALEDDARSPTFIRTVHGMGYAFSAPAVNVTRRLRSGAGSHTCWLAWGKRRYRLGPGEHVIGRDAAADITLDAATLSRRHARIAVTEAGVVLEDAGSKNGTFCGSDRVTSRVALADGDIIRMGSVRLTFHAASRADSTDTEVQART